MVAFFFLNSPPQQNYEIDIVIPILRMGKLRLKGFGNLPNLSAGQDSNLCFKWYGIIKIHFHIITIFKYVEIKGKITTLGFSAFILKS